MSGVLNLLMQLTRGRRFDHHGNLVAFTLNNMTQGVVLWDATGRLVVRNDRYLTMYGISPHLGKPGTALIDIVRHRVATGSLQRDPVQYCAEVLEAIAAGKVMRFVAEMPDGRAISVENRPIPGSSYWVGTHDDITERRSAERKSAALGEHEAHRRALIDEAIMRFRESVEGVLHTVADRQHRTRPPHIPRARFIPPTERSAASRWPQRWRRNCRNRLPKSTASSSAQRRW